MADIRVIATGLRFGARLAPHQVLLERCQLYRQLWAQQHRHMDGRGPRGAVTPRLVRGD